MPPIPQPQSGALVLLQSQNKTGEFWTMGGMRTTRFTLQHHPMDSTDQMSGGWRHLLDSAGLRSISISGHGIFTNALSEQQLRVDAFGAHLRLYRLIFGNGDRMEGRFMITHYERSGAMQEEETYHITLESAGIIDYSSNTEPS
jgi:TP901-1 family phage major tail protein